MIRRTKQSILTALEDAGARVEVLPDWIPPQLATLSKNAPEEHRWLHEIKFDGYRVIIRIDGFKIQVFSRRGNDWTSKFMPIAEELRKYGIRKGLLDGEITVLNQDGISDFQALQSSLRSNSSSRLTLFLFDIMHYEGFDLRPLRLEIRRQVLEWILNRRSAKSVRFSHELPGSPEEMYASACAIGLEGIICKDRTASYKSGRTKSWLKIKCGGREEFVIGGYTPHSDDSKSVGALLLGSFTQSNRLLTYRGKVGTGFNDKERKRLLKELAKLETDQSPFLPSSPLPKRGIRLVRPKLVAEIRFTERTRDGLLRHPSYLGERFDKDVTEMRKELSSR